MSKIIKYAVFTKRIHRHYAPAGFVTSFNVAIDQIDFFPTIEEAEKFIEDETDVYQDRFWTIEKVYIPEPIK